MGEDRLEVGRVDVVQSLLVVDLRQAEDAEAGPEGDHPRSGGRSRDRGCGVLLNARLEKPFRTFLREIPGLHRGGEVAVEDQEGGTSRPGAVLLPHVGEGCAEGGAVVRLLIGAAVGSGSPRGEVSRGGADFPPRRRGGLSKLQGSLEQSGISPQLLHGLDVQLLFGGLAVVFRGILHEGDSLSHDSAAEDHCGNIIHRRRAEGGVELPEGVAVALGHLPSVGLPEGRNVRRHDGIEGSRDLDVVPVHEDGEICQFLLGGDPAGLGALPLGLPSVPHEDVGSSALPAGPLGEGEAHTGGETLAEVAAPPVYSRYCPLHVPLEGGSALAEMGDRVKGVEKSPGGKGRVGSRGGMAVADGDIIPVDLRVILRGEVRHGIDGQIHLQARKGPGGVAAVRGGHHGQYVSAAFGGRFFQSFRHGVRQGFHGEIGQFGKNTVQEKPSF